MILTTLAMSLSLALAPQEDYCAGYRDGWRSVAGQYAIAPVCPIRPASAPSGGSWRSQGFIDGRAAACRSYPTYCR